MAGQAGMSRRAAKVTTMKYLNLLFCLSVFGIAAFHSAPAAAQTPGNRAYNPFSVEFRRAWDVAVSDPVNLIEIGPAKGDKNNLLMLIGGRDPNDYKRELRVTTWAGFQFNTDFSTEFIGKVQDALLLGHFRDAKASPEVKPAKGKSSPKIARQIVTTEGVYEWTGGTFSRQFAAPADVKLALILDKSPDQLLVGSGSAAQLYEIGDNDAHPSQMAALSDGGGYVRLGIGTQEASNTSSAGSGLEIMPGVRYVQSIWVGRNHWYIGLLRGKSLNLPDVPNATTGDRLIVYTPQLKSRDKSFWAMSPKRFSEDFEESWRSDPLPGRVLDVRVGDPKNEGKDGILILTAENNDRARHLYFFAPVSAFGSFGGR
jgi:hypothetical protein